MRAPSEPVKNPSADVEEFARNVARMMEEGGKALAAYLKPREEGRADDQYAEVTDVVKTLGQVADYWLRDPQRALELQSSLGKAYLDLWANAVKRMAGEKVEPVAAPDPRDKRFADPEWSSNQFFDFLKQAYLLTVQWANRLVRDAEGLDPHILQKADFYVRQIANAIAPSNFVLTNPGAVARDPRARRPRTWCAACTCWPRTSRPGTAISDPPVRLQDVRGRPQPRAHARQGGFRERADAAHPVRTVDRDGAQAAAPDRAALDQQVLHPRPHAGKILHQVVRRPGPHRLRHFLGQSRTTRSPRKASKTTCAMVRSPRSTSSRRRPASARSTPSATASAARCWRRRSPTWPASTTNASPRRRSSPPRSISPMPAISRSSSTRSRSRRASAK